MAKERLSKIQKEILKASFDYIKTKRNDDFVLSKKISFKVAHQLNQIYGARYTQPSFQASFSRSLRNLVKKGYIIPVEYNMFNRECWKSDYITSHNPAFKLSKKALIFLNVKQTPLNIKGVF